MKKISTYILLIILITAVNAFVDPQDCGYNFLRAQYQGKCIGNCKKYYSYEDAEVACSNLEECVGISFSSEYQEDDMMFPAHYYLTGKGNYKFSVGQTLMKNCINYRQLKVNNYIEHVGKEYSDCLDNCKSYNTLEEAQEACFNDYECNGVTFSRQMNNYSMGDEWGFQLRSGKDLNPSINGESSWYKIKLEY